MHIRIGGLAAAIGMLIAGVWLSMGTSVAVPGVRFTWPLRPRPAVVRAFDNPTHDWLTGHRGVDLAASPGQPVLAAADGTIVFTGMIGGKPVVSIDHPNGVRTTYEPVVSQLRPGATVARGDPVGELRPGHPGCAEAACLHWGARRGASYIDPTSLIQAVTVRLKPLSGASVRT